MISIKPEKTYTLDDLNEEKTIRIKIGLIAKIRLKDVDNFAEEFTELIKKYEQNE